MTFSTSRNPRHNADRSATSFLFSTFFWTFNVSLLLIIFFGFLPFLGLGILRDMFLGEVPWSIVLPVFGLVGVPLTSTVVGLKRTSKVDSEKPFPPNASPAKTSAGNADALSGPHHIAQFKRRSHQTPAHQDSLAPHFSNPLQFLRSLSLIQIFFGLEAPLLMACMIRLFFLRDLTPAGAFLFISMTVGAIASVHWFLQGYASAFSRPTRLTWLHFAGLTIISALSLYMTAIALFYMLPIFYVTLFLLTVGIATVILLPILFPFGVLFSGLVTMPGGMVMLFCKSWTRLFRQLSSHYGKTRPQLFAISVLVLWMGIFIPLQQQPQTKAFQLLDRPPESTAEVQSLLKNSNVIRQGLLNAYLAEYRYPLVENNWMAELYGSSNWLGFSDAVAQTVQSAYNTLLMPFAYRGTAQDKDKAAELYAAFFDTPILRGEHQAIQTAVLSNFNRAEAKAGLVDINANRVQLEQQDITVTPQGDWAEVELHEVYANQVPDTLEVLYYFSLPESATVTGLWLGETGDRAQRYEHTVSSRGAAQAVYTEQVRRSVDPALLEQVGPRNYRLRAFPIPPRGQDRLPKDGNPDKMHLWLTYKVMKQDNQWPLPVLNERRNVFWTPQTIRTINGERQLSSSPASQQGYGDRLRFTAKTQDDMNRAWLPVSIPASGTDLSRGRSNSAGLEVDLSEVDLPEAARPDADLELGLKTNNPMPQVSISGGYIVAKPLGKNEVQLPEDKRFAVILDGSYSMNEQKQAIAQTLTWMNDHLLTHNTADLYLTRINTDQAEVEDLATFDPNAMVFYGSMPTRQMLAQYQQAVLSKQANEAHGDSKSASSHPAADYDAIILLTDSGSYELETPGDPLDIEAPLWMVHLGGLPAAYDDDTLETLQRSGGNVATEVETVMQRMAISPSLGEKTSLLNVADGYAWFLRQDAEGGAPIVKIGDRDSIAPIAARQWVAQVSQSVKPKDLHQLDAIHQVAKDASIVTPYSSMLVLVNDAQRQQLKAAETQGDRFQREIEDGELPAPQQTLAPVSAVPEPNEWFLLFAGIAILLGRGKYRPGLLQR